jgi:hypothetical protein
MMRNGTCNILGKKYREDVGALSTGIFKYYLQLISTRGGKKLNKTRKLRRVRR